MIFIFLGSKQLLFKKIIFSFFIFSFCYPISLKAQEDFPWEMFLPAITAKPRCDSKNLSLCDTVSDCYYKSGYWYFNKCNSTPTALNSLKYILIDGNLIKYKPNDSISYEGKISGEIKYESSWRCYSSSINISGTGYSYFSSSPIVDAELPSLMRQTIIFKTSTIEQQSIYDFSQDYDGSVSIYYDPEWYYHNFPHGVVWTKSPLKVGESWSFDYHTTMYKEYDWDLYNHKGNYTVVSKEIVEIKIGKFETFKVYYSYEGQSGNSSTLYKENGYVWYYPKIGIIKADLNIGEYLAWPCFSNYKLKYEMTSSNLLKNNLPRE